jgi:hypothetical protein
MSRELFRLVGVWSGCWVVRDFVSGLEKGYDLSAINFSI